MTSVEIDYAALHALSDEQLARLIAAARREQKRRHKAATSCQPEPSQFPRPAMQEIGRSES